MYIRTTLASIIAADPVASIIGDRPIMDSLIGPLTIAVLNTPPNVALDASGNDGPLAGTINIVLRQVGVARAMPYAIGYPIKSAINVEKKAVLTALK